MKKFIIIILLFIVTGMLITYKNQSERYNELLLEKKEYQNKLKEKEKEFSKISKEREMLDTPEVKEKLAREELGYIKKDEIQYILQKESK